MRMKTKLVPTYNATIWIAGDVELAKNICQEFCERDLCVTVTPTTYIYAGGQEDGMVITVGLINYAQFSKPGWEIEGMAMKLAVLLIECLDQQSASVVTEQGTRRWARREEDVVDEISF